MVFAAGGLGKPRTTNPVGSGDHSDLAVYAFTANLDEERVFLTDVMSDVLAKHRDFSIEEVVILAILAVSVANQGHRR